MKTASIVAGCLLVAGGAHAADTSAILTVPGSAIVFVGDGLQAPDQEGHFAIGISLPQFSVRTGHCDTPYLIVSLGVRDAPMANLSAADPTMIARARGTYDQLRAAAAQGGTVELAIRDAPQRVSSSGGVVTTPGCALSMDQDALMQPGG